MFIGVAEGRKGAATSPPSALFIGSHLASFAAIIVASEKLGAGVGLSAHRSLAGTAWAWL